MEADTLAERMKEYESAEAGRVFMHGIPIMARLDGRSFSAFTKSLEKPFDKRLSDLMIATTEYVVKKSGAIAGFTGSDEITLLFYTEDPRSQIIFNGRVQKLNSILSSMVTGYFNKHLGSSIPEKGDILTEFDCRVWQVPTKLEAVNVFMWRELDVTRNAIAMAAQSQFSHTQLLGKSGKEMQEMLFSQKGINFNDYPAFFKRGTYVLKRSKRVKYTSQELDRLPEKHEARSNPDLEYSRQSIQAVELPQMLTIENRKEVIFNGEEPKLKTA